MKDLTRLNFSFDCLVGTSIEFILNSLLDEFKYFKLFNCVNKLHDELFKLLLERFKRSNGNNRLSDVLTMSD